MCIRDRVLDCTEAAVKEGKTAPPKHYTEDTLLSAMETAGKDDTPEDAERKGLGTPATRAAIIEKLVATGFVAVSYTHLDVYKRQGVPYAPNGGEFP